ncbi:hypothetical protein QJS04_geneDACA003120 [Acorus gramineus]|uniref:Uncharacterized protein n=1 Tax=Acorus gramineus TaxID=55184 RepID=A0AAV9BUR1_ACOGR|nr:hypothetical protein QJS04_geneDACA019712 [Acorus gramineus]KAK1280588.1 hypothetical protein QJS04_geneDACA003120 [Acorus gramineus]
MKDYLPSRSNFIEKTISSLGNHFSVRPVTLEAIETPSDSEASYPRTTNLLTEEMLEEHLCHRSEVSGSQRL